MCMWLRQCIYKNNLIFISYKDFIITIAKMSVFTQQFNPITGKSEWSMQPENYDFQQEIARSAYADMLHDKERNRKYNKAIQKAILSMKQQGRPAKVLDIGTGTGLLSLMAVRAGADSVVACEAFKPVAQCALEVIKANKCENLIKVIPKRSTELTVGSGGDIKERANILVAEVFDTELIGEGALATFTHALNHLLEPNPIVVPSAATVYAQVVESRFILNWKILRPIYLDNTNYIVPPKEVENCPGTAAVHDIQMAQLPTSEFKLLSNPVAVFQFDFAIEDTLNMDGFSTNQVLINGNGTCEVIFFWWDLIMDTSGEIVLSCAPKWAHPEPQHMQFRDHWMQAIYYLPRTLSMSKGDVIQLQTYHDEFSFWFNILPCDEAAEIQIPQPECTCMVHCSNSRTRIGMLNDSARNTKYVSLLKQCLNENSICLSVSSSSLLPLIAAKLGAKKVFTVEPQPLLKNVLELYLETNQINNVKIICKEYEDVTCDDLEYKKVDILIAEPIFQSGILPWDVLYFWYLRTTLNIYLRANAIVMPSKITIKGIAVNFEDLWKIRAPVVEAEGFDLRKFDKMVQEAIAISDASIEPHPLWEYKCHPLTEEFELLTFNIKEIIGNKNERISGNKKFISNGICNGVALWVEHHMFDTCISNGLTKPAKVGHQLAWDFNSRQGVYFIQPSKSVRQSLDSLYYEATFDPATGHVNFVFKISMCKNM